MISRLLLLLSVASAATAAPVLVLRAEARVSAAGITLYELLEEYSGVGQDVLGSVVAPAPALGERSTLSRSDIERALGPKLEGATALWSGAEVVSITRPARELTAARIAELVRRQVQAGAGTDARVEIAPPETGAVLFPEAADSVEVDVPPGAPTQRSLVARLRFLEAGRLLLVRQVRVQCALHRPVWRLRQSVDRGTPLEGLLEEAETDVLVSQGALLRSELQPADVVAARELSAGRPLLRADVLPRQLVRRGEPVAVLVQMAAGTVRMQGVALSAGARGELVQVLNPASRKRIQALVTGEGIAALVTGGEGAR